MKISSSRNEDLPLTKDLALTDSTKVVAVSSASKAVEEEKVAVAALLSSSFSEPVQLLETYFNGRVSSETEENACDAAVCSELDCSAEPSGGQRENADLCTDFSASDACAQSDGSTLTAVTQDCGIASSLTAPTPLASVGQVTTSVQLVTNSTSMAPTAPSNSVLVEKLLGPIDRTLAEEVTMAEIFIMAGRPKELTLEYEWVGKSSDSCASGVSALQHLANIALAEYSSFNRISSSVSIHL